jgi:hypothetical protein
VNVGSLVAVWGLRPGTIIMIGRVVEDHGTTLTVESDEIVEGEAAIEYDFHTLPHRTMTVERTRVVPIKEHDAS